MKLKEREVGNFFEAKWEILRGYVCYILIGISFYNRRISFALRKKKQNNLIN